MSKVQYSNEAITRLGLETTISFYQAMSAHQLQCEGIVAVVADLIDPILNLVVSAEISENEIEEKTRDVFRFYQQYGVEWFWQIGPLSQPLVLSRYLLKQGLVLLADCPSMYLDLTGALPGQDLRDFEIHEVPAHDELLEWVKPVREAFASSDKAEGFRRLNARIPHGQGKVFHHYVGYYQGRPVCAGTLFVVDKATMVHNIATRPNFRKRGFGKAMTLHTLHEAKRLGAVHCFLDASLHGMNIYRQVGFQIYSYNQLYGIK